MRRHYFASMRCGEALFCGSVDSSELDIKESAKKLNDDIKIGCFYCNYDENMVLGHNGECKSINDK